MQSHVCLFYSQRNEVKLFFRCTFVVLIFQRTPTARNSCYGYVLNRNINLQYVASEAALILYCPPPFCPRKDSPESGGHSRKISPDLQKKLYGAAERRRGQGFPLHECLCEHCFQMQCSGKTQRELIFITDQYVYV